MSKQIFTLVSVAAALQKLLKSVLRVSSYEFNNIIFMNSLFSADVHYIQNSADHNGEPRSELPIAPAPKKRNTPQIVSRAVDENLCSFSFELDLTERGQS